MKSNISSSFFFVFILSSKVLIWWLEQLYNSKMWFDLDLFLLKKRSLSVVLRFVFTLFEQCWVLCVCVNLGERRGRWYWKTFGCSSEKERKSGISVSSTIRYHRSGVHRREKERRRFLHSTLSHALRRWSQDSILHHHCSSARSHTLQFSLYSHIRCCKQFEDNNRYQITPNSKNLPNSTGISNNPIMT